MGIEGYKDQQQGWRNMRLSCGDGGMKRLTIGLERQGEEVEGWRYTGMRLEGWRPGEVKGFKDLDGGRMG